MGAALRLGIVAADPVHPFLKISSFTMHYVMSSDSVPLPVT